MYSQFNPRLESKLDFRWKYLKVKRKIHPNFSCGYRKLFISVRKFLKKTKNKILN